ncbi:alpha-isopropylmalate synthase regulatory domain-containing protein, partial [Paenibacillus sp. MCAF20]
LELHSLSTGEDAYGEAVVSIVHEGQRFRGTSIHKDIILAAAQAYISACNQAAMTIGSRTVARTKEQKAN